MLFQVLIVFRVLVVIYGLAYKVSNKLPATVLSCSLKNLTVRSNRPELGCVTVCQNTPLCLLACSKNDDECYLFSANVSPLWTGIEMGVLETNDAKCYSTWAEGNDLMYSAATVTGVALLNGSHIASITGGYSCSKTSDVTKMFHSAEVDTPWVLIDLESYHWVKKIIIQVRGDVGYLNHFEFVEARVGNKNTPESFPENTLLMFYDHSANFSEIVTFEGERPLYGRYVSLQSMKNNSYFAFMQMKIIPEIF
ncbi:UNVERIFIED_CONTAM: hypothetical protein RMT77_015694 [Armadillidium vulgare]